MKELESTTNTKIGWISEFFRQHPKSSTTAGQTALRKKFAHGLRWETVRDLRDQVLQSRHANAKSPKLPSVKVTGKVIAATEQSTADARFRQALISFRTAVSDIPDTALRSLNVTIDDQDKWDISYELKRTTNTNFKL